MAEWSYGTNAPEAVKLWSSRLFTVAIQRTVAWKMCHVSAKPGSENNVVQLLDDTQKNKAGDRIRVDLLPKLKGNGVLGDNDISGSEEALSTYYDDVLLNQLRNAVLVKGAMSQQRVPFSMRNAAKNRLADWWSERFDYALLNQATGNTFQADIRWTGNQAVIAPDAQHQLFAGSAASEAALAPGNIFTLDLIDQYVAKAHTLSVPIRPIRLKGKGGELEIFGVLFLHPFQVKSLRVNYTTGQWGDIQRAAMQGGQITGNPIFSGAEQTNGTSLQ